SRPRRNNGCRRRRSTPPPRARCLLLRERCALSVHPEGVLGNLLALPVHAVVAQHRADGDAVILEDRRAALLLRLAMLLQVPPLVHRLLVPPVLEREELALVGDAFEALEL